VVARSKGAPVEVVTINVPDPGPGEAVVKVQACGVCHTDLHYREGGINDEFPFLLGREAAGVVDSSALDPVAAIEEICAQTHEGAEGADVVVHAVGRPRRSLAPCSFSI
jgi:D-arabinose 1-dehydrogenase-like Zn-dependent alcohol dehydrogenase